MDEPRFGSSRQVGREFYGPQEGNSSFTKITKGALALAGILLAGWGPRPALAQDVFTWMMPLEKAAGRLGQLYAKPVTYQGPTAARAQ